MALRAHVEQFVCLQSIRPLYDALGGPNKNGIRGFINLSAKQSISLQSVFSGSTLNVNSQSGAITLPTSGIVTATNINMSSGTTTTINGLMTSSNGTINITGGAGITINQSVTATNGALNIFASSGSIVTSSAATLSAFGNPINVTTQDSNNGSIQLGGSLNVFGSEPQSITVSSARDLKIGSVLDSSTGDIQINSRIGTLQITGSINGKGNVNIRHQGIAAGDRIILSQGASILDYATAAPLGNVTIAITNGAVTSIAGNPPAGGTVTQIKSNGQINFGPGTFSNSGSTLLYAKGANMTFFRDVNAADGANAIQLNSNTIVADPPVGPSGAFPMTTVATPVNAAFSSGEAAAQLMPSANHPMLPPMSLRTANGLDAELSLTRAANQFGRIHSSTSALDLVDPLRLPCQRDSSDQGARRNAGANQSAAISPLLNVPDREGASTLIQSQGSDATHVFFGFVNRKSRFGPRSGSNYLKSSAGSAVGSATDGGINLRAGEILVAPSKGTTITAGTHKVILASGAIVHVVRDSTHLKIHNLCDSGANSVKVLSSAGRLLTVGIGQELILATEDGSYKLPPRDENIGRRKVERFVMDGNQAMRSEVSTIALIQSSDLLRAVYTGTSPADKCIMDRIIKMAAALFQVTGKRGAYSAFDPAVQNTDRNRSSDRTLRIAQSEN